MLEISRIALLRTTPEREAARHADLDDCIRRAGGCSTTGSGSRSTAEDPKTWYTGRAIEARRRRGGEPDVKAVTWSCDPRPTATDVPATADDRNRCRPAHGIPTPTPPMPSRRRNALRQPDAVRTANDRPTAKITFNIAAIMQSAVCSMPLRPTPGRAIGWDESTRHSRRYEAALTHAEQLRSAHEFPTLAGSATLPFITDFYQIGDRVKIIQGRNANLQINVGVDQGEAPTYPWITAFAWDFQGDKQQTILQFS